MRPASTISPRAFSMGGVKCSTHTIPQLLGEIESLLLHRYDQPRSILCVNAHIYNVAFKDAALRESLNTARIVSADGMSIVWLSRLWNAIVPERCNMTEAFRAFLQSKTMRPSTAVLIGLTQREAERAANSINRTTRHCHIVKAYSGFFSDEEYAEVFETLGDADFIFVGMSTPRTERTCELARRKCPGAIVWGIGAGTIRIYAGTMREASPFFRRHGLQWLHRLANEPFKLWRRYLIGNPLFVYRAIKSSIYARRGSVSVPPAIHG